MHKNLYKIYLLCFLSITQVAQVQKMGKNVDTKFYTHVYLVAPNEQKLWVHPLDVLFKTNRLL